MKLISHRANLNGIEKNQENNPSKILDVIERGFDVEIDVWYESGNLYLGHDTPDYKIESNFIISNYKNLWCHAKNLNALQKLLSFKEVNCFWHQSDDYTLTSKGFIWTYPKRLVSKNNIIVCTNLEETLYYSKQDIFGICSDYVQLIK